MFPKLLHKPKRSPRRPTLHGEPVSWTILHAYIISRDRVCLAFLFSIRAGVEHACKSRYGLTHDPYNRGALSLEHVPDPGRKGLGMRREIAAPDNELHLVAMCHGANIAGPSEALRDFCRTWIAEHEPAIV